ncbi:hypothetical protein [Azonexus sp.]|uniref:hypothetical protein n=1 Tax=Azonexus sp. TaxID=1872668 RepID=UPI00283A9BAF|nr:hypothetical protein [Azonexus sp.]
MNTIANARFLRLTLLTGLLAGCALPALAQTAYVNAKGEQHASPVTATALIGGEVTTLETGWYLCNGSINYTGTITISGDVNLILGDGCDMRVTGSKDNAGINVTGSNSLTITASANSSGKRLLIAHAGVESNGAGIGGGRERENGGVITINGGTIIATGGYGVGALGPGIGGGPRSNGGAITINNGMVIATSGDGYGAKGTGIGCGYEGSDGTITINGGTVHAISGINSPRFGGGAGIGGCYGNGSTITIHGGTVDARGGSSRGPGIGGGGTVTVRGGTVNAAGGIGGEAGIVASVVNIYGGTVNANGGSSEAGISGGTITIHGGTINAAGGNGGAGIGGSGAVFGNTGSNAGTIIIATSSKVLAKGGEANSWNGLGAGAAIGQGGYRNGESGAGIRPIPKLADTAVVAGGNAAFRVNVKTTGKPAPKLAYQWQQSTDGGENWSSLTGATRAILKMSGVTARMNGYLYRCVVTVTGIGEKSSITYTTDSARLTVRQ